MCAAIGGGQGGDDAAQPKSALTEIEMLFIGRRDLFYVASVSEVGWPNVRRRGGAPGFIRAINPTTLVFPEFSESQPLLAEADGSVDDRVAILFTDYAKARSLRVMGRLTLRPLEDAPYLAAELLGSMGDLDVERVGSIRVESFDWSSPNDIARRYTAAELAPLTRRVSALEAENAILQAKIAGLTGRGT
jgi:hypothetical protein